MAYGIGSSNTTATTITMTGTAPSVRENTVLEEHLSALRGLQEELNKAFSRSLQVADRFLGQEPPTINKPDGAATNAVEPPLLRRLELAANQAADMVQSIHYQLGRLERL